MLSCACSLNWSRTMDFSAQTRGPLVVDVRMSRTRGKSEPLTPVQPTQAVSSRHQIDFEYLVTT
jgi:hypothetical protein